jgi:hypothetical protein
MLSNVNQETGIRYGVIALNSLDQDLAQELQFGANAVDLSYEQAYSDAKAEATAAYGRFKEEAELAASETDLNMSDRAREAFVENHVLNASEGRDLLQYEDDAMEQFSDLYQSCEPTIEGAYGGVKYRISWLGGAPMLWVLDSPWTTIGKLCSPCVPGAVDLDAGCGESEGYDVPQDWRAQPNTYAAAA